MARKDTVLLFVPAIIGGIIILSIFLLDIQLANFQDAYFEEVAEETKRNNFYLVRVFRDLLESNQLGKMHRMLNSNHGPNPMIVKIIARGKGVITETEGVPAYLVEHIREPEIKDIFKTNREENVLVKFDRNLNSFMIYHSVRFHARGQDYVLVMASKCNSMTILMRQTRLGILILSLLGILSTLALTGFALWVSSFSSNSLLSLALTVLMALLPYACIPLSGIADIDMTWPVWLENLLPSGSFSLINGMRFQLINLRFLSFCGLSVWTPFVMLAAPVIETPLFPLLARRAYTRHEGA